MNTKHRIPDQRSFSPRQRAKTLPTTNRAKTASIPNIPTEPTLLQNISPKTADDAPPFRKILVAVDRPCHPALATASNLARSMKAHLAVLFVIDTASNAIDDLALLRNRESRQLSQEILHAARENAPLGICVSTFERHGKPDQEIIALARQWQPDVLVMGTHRRSAAATYYLGSNSRGVIRGVDCPVLLVTDTSEPPPAFTDAPDDELAKGLLDMRSPWLR